MEASARALAPGRSSGAARAVGNSGNLRVATVPANGAPQRGAGDGVSAAAAGRSSAPGGVASVVDAIKRSPLMLDLPTDTPGLAKVAALDDDEITAAAIALVREHGLLDARAMVTDDVAVLFTPRQDDLALFQSLQSDGGSRSPRSRARVPADAAAVADALKRSPLMLDLPASHPGLSAIADLPEDLVSAGAVYLVREHGLLDAKELVQSDFSLLRDAGIKAKAKADAEAKAAAEFEAAAAAASAAGPIPAELAAAVDALKRSPLMLDLPANHPGLAALEGIPDDLVLATAVSLVREHGLLDAKALILESADVIAARAPAVAAQLEAEAAAAAAEAAAAFAEVSDELSVAVAALKRSPIMLEVGGDHPGLDAISGLPDDLIVDAVTVLVRERGWFDAKNAVAADASVLVAAADRALVIREEEEAARAAEAAAAAEAGAAAVAEAAGEVVETPAPAAWSAPAAPKAAAAPAGPVGAAIEAIKRSPIMLELSPSAPGLSAVSKLADDLIVDAVTVLVRERGWFDAKNAVAADASVLVAAADRALVIREEEEAARAAEAEAAAAAEAAGEVVETPAPAAWSAPAAPKAAAAPAGPVGAAIEAIKRSPIMLELSPSAPGLSAVSKLADDLIVDAVTVLVRERGWFDAKNAVAADASVLVAAADRALVIREEEEAARAAEAAAAAEAEAAAAAEAAGEVVETPAPAAWSAPAAPKAAAAPAGPVGAAIEAIKRSPIMLELSPSAPGLSAVSKLADDLIVDAVTVLVRERGWFDAKNAVAADASVLVAAADRALVIREEEEAARAAEAAAAAEAEAAAAAEAAGEVVETPAPAAWSAPAAPKAAAAPAGPVGAAIEAIKRSPIMLELSPSAPGLSAVSKLADDLIVDAVTVLVRERGWFDAKNAVAADASVLVAAADRALVIREEEEAARAAEAAAAAEAEAAAAAEAEAAAAAEAAGEVVETPAPAAWSAPAAPKAAAAPAGPVGAAIEAIKRSPIMLELSPSAPGLSAVSKLADDLIVDAVTVLVRERGWFDAKNAVAADASVLVAAADRALVIREEEEAARAAEAAAAAEAEAAAAAEAAGEVVETPAPAAWSAPAAPKAAAAPAGPVGAAIEAIKRSPIMLELSPSAPGLSAVSKLADDLIVDAVTVLVRERGWFDAKNAVAADASVLVAAADRALVIREEEEAARAAEAAAAAEAEAAAAAEAAGEVVETPAPAAWSAPAAPKAAAAPAGPVGAAIEAIKRSPIMLELSPSAPGLSAVSKLADDLIVDAVTVLVRERGWFDAKNAVAADASVLVAAADRALVIREEEEAARAAEAAAAAEAEAAAAAEAEAAAAAEAAGEVVETPAPAAWSAPAAPKAAAAPAGPVGAAIEAIKRSPIMLELSPSAPGLSAVSKLADDLIVDAVTVLVRERGWFDAKNAVAADASVLVAAADRALVIREEEEAARAAEAAAAAEAEAAAAAEAAGEVVETPAPAAWSAPAAPKAAAAPAGPVGAAIEAIKRSPIMLELSPSAPGLSAVSKLADDLIVDAVTVLVRERGWFDAKNAVAADASVLVAAADRALVIREEEEAARAAEAAAAAEAEAAAAAEAAGEVVETPAPAAWSAPAAPKAAAAPAGPVGAALEAIKRSPIMLELSPSAPGLSAVSKLADDLIVDAVTVLVRERGWFDAKNAVAADASVLVAAADRALVIRGEEEAARAAEAAAAAEAEAAAAAEAAGEVVETPAPAAWSAPAAPKAAAAPAGPVGAAIEAIKRSPIMLELSPSAPGLSAVSKLADDLIVDAVTVLVRERGWFDAKNAVAADASVLVAAADRALVIREEEEAARAAEAAAAAEAEAAAAAEAEAAAAAEAAGEVVETPAPAAWSAPAAPKAAAAPAGPVGAAIEAIKRSPIMLELSPSAPGLSAVSKLADDLIVDAVTVLVRERGWFDAKNAVAADASVLVAAADRALVIRGEEEAARAAEAAAAAEAEAAAAAEAAGESLPASSAPPSVVAGVLGAIKRSPLMLELPANHPGLDVIADMPEDLAVAAATYLVREHGLLDAKALVARSAEVLAPAAEAALAIWEAEAAARAAEAALLAEAEAAAAAGVAEPSAPAVAHVSNVIDAISRSPLMLELKPDHPGLSIIADMPEDLVVDAVTFLVREVGWMDAKRYVLEDAEVLAEAADEVLIVREAEARAKAAAELEAAQQEDDDNDDTPSSGGTAASATGASAPSRAAEAVAVAAAVAAAASAATAPAKPRPDGWARARESPGLALLAAGSIVWNLLGPLGGAFVKFAQHPAATPGLVSAAGVVQVEVSEPQGSIKPAYQAMTAPELRNPPRSSSSSNPRTANMPGTA